MHLAYAAKLGLSIRKTDVGAQKLIEPPWRLSGRSLKCLSLLSAVQTYGLQRKGSLGGLYRCKHLAHDQEVRSLIEFILLWLVCDFQSL